MIPTLRPTVGAPDPTHGSGPARVPAVRRAARIAGRVAPGLAHAAALALPVAILFTRTGAEIAIGTVDVAFLVGVAFGTAPFRRVIATVSIGLAVFGCTWWASVVLASALRLPFDGAHPLVEAVVQARYGLLVIAFATFALPTDAARRRMAVAIGLAASWIVIECWQQLLTGHDLFGWPRWGDGALTGPFREPRAGPELLLVLFPALLPPVASALARRRPVWTAGAVALVAVALATAVLIGQRMPALLIAFGLVVAAAFQRPLRPVAAGALAIGLVVLALTPLVSPPTWNKLVVHFAAQMSHFRQSDYGLIFVRAATMTRAHPWFGLGLDGFRHHCADPAYAHGIAVLGVSDQLARAAGACNIHPHNHYLEAATASGLPGLVLFAATAVAAIAAVGRALRDPAPPAIAGRRLGFTVTLVVALFPFASASAFFTLPLAGWFFVVLGAGLAERGAPERLPVP